MVKASIALVLLLAGCGEVHYIARPIQAPPRPVLPKVYESDLRCLSDDTYKRLVERDRLRKNYAETLEALINSTHGR